jgi:hypothetical protein
LPRKKGALAPRIHTGIRLDAAIVERLSASGERGKISDQIRERLLRTFADDDLDAATRDLRNFLVNIAATLRADFGCEWHYKPRAHEAFAAAVAERIGVYRPRLSGGASDLVYWGPTNDPPDVIGRLRERDDRRAHDYPSLRTADERTAKSRRAAIASHVRSKQGKDHE